MTRNEKRFGVIGTIGNGEPLIAAPIRSSYHVFQRADWNDKKEIAIKMDRDSAIDLAAEVSARDPQTIVTVVRKPILRIACD